MLAYYFARFASFILCILPSGFCECIGKLFGELTWHVVPKKRRSMACDNVMRCLRVDEKEAERIAKASWVRFGPMLMEVMRFPKLKDHFGDFVEIEGKELLEEGLALGHGAVIATSHCGNWELMGGALSKFGISLVGVAKKQKEEGFDRFINEYRRMVGMHITYKDVRYAQKRLDYRSSDGSGYQPARRYNFRLVRAADKLRAGACSFGAFSKCPAFSGVYYEDAGRTPQNYNSSSDFRGKDKG